MSDGVVNRTASPGVVRAVRALQRAVRDGTVMAIVIFSDNGVPSVLVPGHVPMEREKKAFLCDAIMTGLQIYGFVQYVGSDPDDGRS